MRRSCVRIVRHVREKEKEMGMGKVSYGWVFTCEDSGFILTNVHVRTHERNMILNRKGVWDLFGKM